MTKNMIARYHRPPDRLGRNLRRRPALGLAGMANAAVTTNGATGPGSSINPRASRPSRRRPRSRAGTTTTASGTSTP